MPRRKKKTRRVLKEMKQVKKRKRTKKELTGKQIARKKKRELNVKIKKLDALKEYFVKHKKELNKLDYNIWCKKCSCGLILGVCLYRRLNISNVVTYKECKRCTVHINEYMKVFDFIGKDKKTFMNLAIVGKVDCNDINLYVEDWKNNYKGIQSLRTFLGMEHKEYNIWMKKPKLLDFIIKVHKKGKSDQIEELLIKSKQKKKSKVKKKKSKVKKKKSKVNKRKVNKKKVNKKK